MVTWTWQDSDEAALNDELGLFVCKRTLRLFPRATARQKMVKTGLLSWGSWKDENSRSSYTNNWTKVPFFPHEMISTELRFNLAWKLGVIPTNPAHLYVHAVVATGGGKFNLIPQENRWKSTKCLESSGRKNMHFFEKWWCNEWRRPFPMCASFEETRDNFVCEGTKIWIFGDWGSFCWKLICWGHILDLTTFTDNHKWLKIVYDRNAATGLKTGSMG